MPSPPARSRSRSPPGAVKNADTTDASGATVTGAQNITTTNMFALEGPTAVLTNPGNGGTIDINVVNGRNWIDVTFNEPTCTTAPCMTINQNSITSLTPKFTLGGAGLGTLALDSTQAPVLMGNTPTTLTYRFWLTGEAANTSTAPVTLTFLANSWSYYLPSLPALPSVTVGVTSSGGAFVGPVTVQITIPDAADTGHTDPLLTGFNVDPTSLVLKDLVFTTTTTGWSVVIDPTRAITLVAGTTDEFNIPVLVTLPGTGLSATSSAVFDVAFQAATDIAYFGNPGGATQSGTNGGNTYTAASFPSNRSYVDVAFSPASGQTLVSVPSPGNGQITLSGSGAQRRELRLGLTDGARRRRVPVSADRQLRRRHRHGDRRGGRGDVQRRPRSSRPPDHRHRFKPSDDHVVHGAGPDRRRRRHRSDHWNRHLAGRRIDRPLGDQRHRLHRDQLPRHESGTRSIRRRSPATRSRCATPTATSSR